MDGLWVRDPQAFFLRDGITVRNQLRAIAEREVYPKRAVPASYASVFFQNALFDDTRFFTVPEPKVACSRICEAVLFSMCGTRRYRVSKMDSSALERP